MAWRTAARLRREMLDEAALAAQPSPAAPSPAAPAAATPPPAAPAAARPAAAGPAAGGPAGDWFAEPRDNLDLIDPVADPLGAAVHKLHREADRRHAEQRRAAQTAAAAPEPPPPPEPPADPPSGDPVTGDPPAGEAEPSAKVELGPEFQAAFLAELIQLPQEIQDRLLTFSADDMNRLFAELMRIELARAEHEAEQAARQRDGP